MEEEVDKGAAPLGSGQLTAPASPLPDEMVFEILLRLPIKNLHQCNCVSKAWRSLISSPVFTQDYKVRRPDVGLLAAIWEPSGLAIVNFYYSTLRIPEPKEFVSRFMVPLVDYECEQITEVCRGLVCIYNWNSLFLCNIFTSEVMQGRNQKKGEGGAGRRRGDQEPVAPRKAAATD